MHVSEFLPLVMAHVADMLRDAADHADRDREARIDPPPPESLEKFDFAPMGYEHRPLYRKHAP